MRKWQPVCLSVRRQPSTVSSNLRPTKERDEQRGCFFMHVRAQLSALLVGGSGARRPFSLNGGAGSLRLHRDDNGRRLPPPRRQRSSCRPCSDRDDAHPPETARRRCEMGVADWPHAAN